MKYFAEIILDARIKYLECFQKNKKRQYKMVRMNKYIAN